MDFPKSHQQLNTQDELQQLREENARLKALLTQHGIALEEPITPEPVPVPLEPAPIRTQFTTDDKIALFRHLFRGREDVYPLRWESAKEPSGYSPACAHEWKPGICRKPKVKCGNFVDRDKIRIAFSWVYQAFGWGRGR